MSANNLSDRTPFYMTSAISYPNAKPHIGHLYEYMVCDTIARFRRSCGYDVFFVTGTDEHGLKMQQTANRLNIPPKELVDRNMKFFDDMMQLCNGSHDDFIRTTQLRHKAAVLDIWQKISDNGDIYLGSYDGWYCVREEAFFKEDELVKNEAGDYVTESGASVEWVKEESYFFKLSAYQQKLLDFYAAYPNFVRPKSRFNEIIRFVESGLDDLSVSRVSLDWGIRLDNNPKHCVYVWLDALTAYISAIGYPDMSSENMSKYWPADLHLIGKDILRFHAVYWPAFLMSAGLKLPKLIFSHGFILNRGEKMSKSLGNIVDPFDLCQTYHPDMLRYFFMREVSFGQDGHYSHQAIANRCNADLANDLGNLVQRSLSMVFKLCQQSCPQNNGCLSEDEDILAKAYGVRKKTVEHMDKYELHLALAAIWEVVAMANRYFSQQKPWELHKSDPKRMNTVLYVACELLRIFAILLYPFIPVACEKLFYMLGIDKNHRLYSYLTREHCMRYGASIKNPTPLFPRIQIK